MKRLEEVEGNLAVKMAEKKKVEDEVDALNKKLEES